VKPALRFLFSAVTALLLIPIASAQVPQLSPFSADLQITSTGTGAGPHDVTGQVYVGSGHIRVNMESSGHKTALLTDFATRITDILLLDQQMYIERKVSQTPGSAPTTVAQDLQPFDPDHPCASQPDVTCKKIGVEEVSGRTCDHWEVTDKQGRVTNLWIDQKLHFPVKVTSQDSTMLLSNIKEGQPDASLFVIPSGFEKLETSPPKPPRAAGPPNPPHQ
jgi:hypothetical protein